MGGVCDGSLEKNRVSGQTEETDTSPSYSVCEVTHETCSCQIQNKKTFSI